MADEMMDSLRQAFMKDKEQSGDECPMAEQTTAYAFGELGEEESQKAKEHLHSCRSCLDLFMEIKMAEEEAGSAEGQKAEVLPGLQKAIDRKKQPSESFWQKIRGSISGLFSGSSLKPVAAFAVAVLVIGVGIYIISDKGGVTQGKPYSMEIVMHGRTVIGFRGDQPEFRKFQVEPGGTLQSGDYFRFQTKIDRPAYVYVVFQDSAGKIDTMKKGRVPGNKAFFLPAGDKWFQLDQTTGTERLYMVASENEIDDFGQRIDWLKTEGIDTIDKVFPEATIQSFSFEHR